MAALILLSAIFDERECDDGSDSVETLCAGTSASLELSQAQVRSELWCLPQHS